MPPTLMDIQSRAAAIGNKRGYMLRDGVLIDLDTGQPVSAEKQRQLQASNVEFNQYMNSPEEAAARTAAHAQPTLGEIGAKSNLPPSDGSHRRLSQSDPFAGYQWHQGGQLTMRGPNGETQAFPSGHYPDIDRLAREGWTPLNEQGNPFQVREYLGGTMFKDPDRNQWMPLNVLLGGAWLPEQQAEMPRFLQSIGEPPQTGNTGTPPGTTGGGYQRPARGQVNIRMADGQQRTVQWNSPELVQALQAGGQVLDPSGQPLKVFQAYGGWMAEDPSGIPLPMNVIAGEGWMPYQQEMVGNYLNAGWKPGMGALPKDPPVPRGAADMYGYPEGDSYDPGHESVRQPPPPGQTEALGQGSPMDAGYFAEPFNEQFQFGRPEPQFQFNPKDVLQDPSYQFMLDEGLKALDRSASAKGILGGGRAAKEITRFGQGLASDFGSELYGRKFGEYQTNLQNFNQDWQRQMAEFAQKRDIHRTNRSDIFGRYASLADVGLPATTATGNFGAQFGQNAGGLITDAGAARAGGQLGAGLARQRAFTNIADAAYPYYMRQIGAR